MSLLGRGKSSEPGEVSRLLGEGGVRSAVGFLSPEVSQGSRCEGTSGKRGVGGRSERALASGKE